MWTKVVIFLLTIPSIQCAKEFITVKIGETVKLNDGPNVDMWVRSRKKDVYESIKYCEPNEKASICKFVDTHDKPVLPKSRAHVEKDGTLIIESIKASDADFYSLVKKDSNHVDRNGDRVGKLAKVYILKVKS